MFDLPFLLSDIHARVYLDIKPHIKKEELEYLFKHKIIVSMAGGGFIKGPFHENNGIKVLLHAETGYNIACEIEGYEFAINSKATINNYNFLDQLNSSFKDFHDFEEYDIPKNITIIDASPVMIDNMIISKFLVTSNNYQAIMNKHATKEHYKLFESLNKQNLV